MDEKYLHWLVGLIEGEGTFGINIAIRPGGGFAIAPTFKLSLSEKDKSTVFYIKDLLGLGRIDFKSNKIWLDRGMKNIQNQYVFIIDNIPDVLEFLDVFDVSVFRTSKKKDYILWKDGIEIIRNFEHLTYGGFMKICEIRDKMNLMQKRKNYKNKEWFVNFLKNCPNFFSEKNLAKRKKQSLAIRAHFNAKSQVYKSLLV